jgi:hypothetical protein
MRRYSRRDVWEILGRSARDWRVRDRRRRFECGIQIGTVDTRYRIFVERHGREEELVGEHIRSWFETAFVVRTDAGRAAAEIAAFRISRRFFSIGVHGTHEDKLDERRWW